ncbi:hypothetical Protein psc5_07310 [Candidatus Phytoplasma solani]
MARFCKITFLKKTGQSFLNDTCLKKKKKLLITKKTGK